MYDSVPYSRNTQGTLFGFSWFVDVDPAYLLSLEMMKRILNVIYYPRKGFLQVVLSHGFVIHAGSFAALVAFDVVDCCYDSSFC